MENFNEKLQAFIAKFQADHDDNMRRMGYDLQIPQNQVHAHEAKKYTRVDIGSSGRYMVVNDTGEIFGIKAYGVIHRGHQYGTLETIENFYWGCYHATKLKAVKS